MDTEGDSAQQAMRTAAFLIATFLAVLWLGEGLLNPPSSQFHNPYKTHQADRDARTDLVPPPRIDAEGKATRQQSEREIEEWRAARSDLAAQWETADLTNLAFRAGVLGIILVAWTLAETRLAGAVNQRSLKANENTAYRQLRAYLSVKQAIRPISGSRPMGLDISITNHGQTPAEDVKIRTRLLGQRSTELVQTHGDFQYAANGKTVPYPEEFSVAPGETVMKRSASGPTNLHLPNALPSWWHLDIFIDFLDHKGLPRSFHGRYKLRGVATPKAGGKVYSVVTGGLAEPVPIPMTIVFERHDKQQQEDK